VNRPGIFFDLSRDQRSRKFNCSNPLTIKDDTIMRFLKIFLFFFVFSLLFFIDQYRPVSPVESFNRQLTEAKRARKERNPIKPFDKPDKAAAFMYQQRAYPDGRIPADGRFKALAAAQSESALRKETGSDSLHWTAAGPVNIGGRVRSLYIDPANPDYMLLGSVSGGLWKTVNGGLEWIPLTDQLPNLAIGAIAVNPSNPQQIFIGTGEGFYNIDAVRGNGIFRSDDGGESWSQIPTTNTSRFYYVSGLEFARDNSSIVIAVTNDGLMQSSNGGIFWTRRQVGHFTQLVADPVDPATFYASEGSFYSGGIWKTTDHGSSWSKLTGGLPETGFGRIVIAVAPSNPQIVYAAFTNSGDSGLKGLYRSDNGGNTWTLRTTVPNWLGGQGWYDNTLAVHPEDAEIVFAGGLDLYRSTNGGLTFTQKSWWYYSHNHPQFVHADQHVIQFHPGNSNRLYVCNDGGIFTSSDQGSSWNNLNYGLEITQFYSGALHPSEYNFIGGTQDNGTLINQSNREWNAIYGGDGGVTAINHVLPSIMYTEYINLDFLKSTDGGQTFFSAMTGIPQGSDAGTSDRVLFIAPFEMAPSASGTLVAGTYRVYRTVNHAISWQAISPDLTNGGTVSAFAFSRESASLILAGTSDGQIHIMEGIPNEWRNLNTGDLPNRYVTDLLFNPENDSILYATFSGYGSPHVFRSNNRGNSWYAITAGLPDTPVSTITVSPFDSSRLVIGTDIGVFDSRDGGNSWQLANNGLPAVVVVDLDTRSDGTVLAATHGRGMYTANFLDPATTVETGSRPSVATEFHLAPAYPNPFNPATTLPVVLPSAGTVTVRIYDVLGRMVDKFENSFSTAGRQQLRWQAGDLAGGIYLAVAAYRGENGETSVASRKLVLLK
jgi:photosystem II stability/assembly factor-like uncharacterized protein